ncbi:hypothetical protein [Bradyrhizobium sp. USDA 4452]
MFENDTPPNSREEAWARRIRPVEERYDPDKLSHWSITMTIAWIVWGDLGRVREQWNTFREECADWTFHSNPAALAEVGKLALRNLEAGDIAPNDPELDRRLKSGEWRLASWGPSSWYGLEMRIRSEGIHPDVSIDALWLAAGENKIKATGLECADASDFNGKMVEIPHYLWSRLLRGKEPSGKAILIGPDRVYRDVEFARLDVKRLWPLGRSEDVAEARCAEEDSEYAVDNDSSIGEPVDSAPRSTSVNRRIAEREIEPMFKRWRAQQPAGYVPTATEDIAHMKRYGVSRAEVRELVKKFGGRKRGEKSR